MNNYDLVEAILNKTITLEEAIEISDDVNDLLNILNIRKSMRYALKSALYAKKAIQQYSKLAMTERTLTSLYYSQLSYKGWIIRYSKMADKLYDRMTEIENKELSKIYWQYNKSWLIDDLEAQYEQIEGTISHYRDMMEIQKGYADETKIKLAKVTNRYIAERTNYDQLQYMTRKYRIASIITTVTDIIDYLAETLGE